jgi:murein DD-endopeptidase MepM/ murein hydrolase activator NlpD
VRGGRRVGELGCTGSCSGDHLHFEVRRGRGLEGRAEDPLPHLLGWSRRSAARATLPPGAR